MTRDDGNCGETKRSEQNRTQAERNRDEKKGADLSRTELKMLGDELNRQEENRTQSEKPRVEAKRTD